MEVSEVRGGDRFGGGQLSLLPFRKSAIWVILRIGFGVWCGMARHWTLLEDFGVSVVGWKLEGVGGFACSRLFGLTI